MKLSELVAGLPFTCIVDAGDPDVRAIITDSRQVTPGSLFMAREGWFVDSHAFIDDAIARGAVAVIVMRDDAVGADCPVPVYRAAHEDRDLGLLADRFFGAPTESLRVYAVTGTNGKTSVAWMLEHLLRAAGERPAVMGTVAHRFEGRTIPARNTTPDGRTIHGFARDVLDAGATALVMEASSHGLELQRVAGVVFDVVGFTNLSVDHLDFHETIDAYRDAKHRLFASCVDASNARGADVVAVARIDDEEGRRALGATTAARQCTVATTATAADVALVPIAADVTEGIRFEARAFDRVERAVAPLVGMHNLENLAIAAGMVAATHGAAVHDALAAMADFAGVPGRFERVAAPRKSESVVFVDYAHSPDAVARAVRALADAGDPPVVVVGAGGDRDATKRPDMARAALDGAAHVVLTSDNPRSEAPDAILAQMQAGVPGEARDRVTVIERRDDAIAAAIERAEGAPVLVLGKGHETYQEIGGKRYAFDDREVARRVLAARGHGRPVDDIPLLAGWTADRLATAGGGRLVARGPVRPLGPLSTDTRSLAFGDVFVALRGERFDGHRFVGAALDRGASAVVVDDASAVPPCRAAVIEVDDTALALQRVATALLTAARAQRDGCAVIGVTGSNGKTTTKELIAAIARAAGIPTLATAGNYNNHIGLPLTVGRIGAAHRLAVLEMGANAPNDIYELAAIARHDVGVLTSIGLAHVEGFGGIDGIRAAKAGIATGQPPRVLVMPHTERDEPAWAGRIEDSTTVITIGTGEGATIRVSRASSDGRVQLDGHGPLAGWSAEVELALPGMHNALNLATALAAVAARDGDIAAGMPSAEAIARAASTVTLPHGRLRRMQIAGRTLVDDAYNANPSSVRASLGLLAEASRPRIAVLGDMLELGDTSEDLHRQTGAFAATCADVVIGVGPRSTALVAGAAAVEAIHVATAEDAVDAIAARAPRGATVWLKGSRAIGLERIVTPLAARWEGD